LASHVFTVLLEDQLSGSSSATSSRTWHTKSARFSRFFDDARSRMSSSQQRQLMQAAQMHCECNGVHLVHAAFLPAVRPAVTYRGWANLGQAFGVGRGGPGLGGAPRGVDEHASAKQAHQDLHRNEQPLLSQHLLAVAAPLRPAGMGVQQVTRERHTGRSSRAPARVQ
jgi:hypothetical protein